MEDLITKFPNKKVVRTDGAIGLTSEEMALLRWKPGTIVYATVNPVDRSISFDEKPPETSESN